MDELRSAHLFSLNINLKEPWYLGVTPLGHRQVFDFARRYESRAHQVMAVQQPVR